MRESGKRHDISIFVSHNKKIILSYIIMIIVVTLFIANQKNFFTRYGIKSTFDQFLTLLYASLAQTLVILTGGIDLSIGALIGLTNSVAAVIMVPLSNIIGSDAVSIALTIMIVLAIGSISGLINGLLIVYGRLQPIIVTLSTSFIFTGIGLYLRPTPGGSVVKGFSKLMTGYGPLGIPMSVIWMLAAIFIFWIPLRRSKYGQSVYAVGGSEYSAYASGIQVKKVKVTTYLLSGFFCALSGLLLTSQTASGDPTSCGEFAMNAVAAFVLGGGSLAGGRGSFIGTIAGVVIFSLIIGLLIFWGINAFYQDAVKGIILILALALGVVEEVNFKKDPNPNRS